MKIRAKYCGIYRLVEVENDQCTLSELHQKTADAFLLDASSFTLSLNKCDALTGHDKTLAEFSIVTGDLLFILTSEPAQHSANNNINNCANGTNSVQSDSSSSSSCAGNAEQVGDTLVTSNCISACGNGLMNLNGFNDASNRDLDDFEHPVEDLTDENAGICIQDPSSVQHENEDTEGESDVHLPLPMEDPEVNRCLLEPLLCRESTPTSVPAMLRDLYTGASCCSNNDALWIVIHALMMEVGFRPVQNVGLSLEENWNRKGFYRQEYRHLFVTTPHSCCIVGVPMGTVLIVRGTASEDPPSQTHSEQVKVNNFIEGPIADKDVCQVYKNLEKLSDAIKDFVCQPLLAHLSEVCGFPVSLGLLPLSYELKLKLLSYLPASSLLKMAQVCRGYSVACKDPYLWRRLYLRELGRNGNTSLNRDWYKLYKEEFVRRREHRRAARHRPVLTGIPPWLNPPPGHFNPWLPPAMPFGGGIIGGDYDINPEFATNIPHPLFGRRMPGPTLPFGGAFSGPFAPRPRYDDPYGPGGSPFEQTGVPFGPAGVPFGPAGGPFGPSNIGPGGGAPGSHLMALGRGSIHHNRTSPFSSLGGRRF